MPPSALRLTWILRGIGAIDLLAFVAMLLPLENVAAAHQTLAMGPFPADPVVIYLVRSASMLYGLCGLLLMFLSGDVVRYAPVIRFIACCGMAAGPVLAGIGTLSGMPGWWIRLEGPACTVLWAIVWMSSRDLVSQSRGDRKECRGRGTADRGTGDA